MCNNAHEELAHSACNGRFGVVPGGLQIAHGSHGEGIHAESRVLVPALLIALASKASVVTARVTCTRSALRAFPARGRRRRWLRPLAVSRRHSRDAAVAGFAKSIALCRARRAAADKGIRFLAVPGGIWAVLQNRVRSRASPSAPPWSESCSEQTVPRRS
jgi:hypothetical protein